MAHAQKREADIIMIIIIIISSSRAILRTPGALSLLTMGSPLPSISKTLKGTTAHM